MRGARGDKTSTLIQGSGRPLHAWGTWISFTVANHDGTTPPPRTWGAYSMKGRPRRREEEAGARNRGGAIAIRGNGSAECKARATAYSNER